MGEVTAREQVRETQSINPGGSVKRGLKELGPQGQAPVLVLKRTLKQALEQKLGETLEQTQDWAPGLESTLCLRELAA
ncbi:hypothetical protein ROHU_023578 [Labeo rohita]|uniref:Uncharacterized protein n=1 Tax=Labeo rohita TaxID=84645 RepID=A0A498MMA9_LABRO|nr:hypothetical protein ROHU_023578 [Labeo rohita]